MSRPTRPVRLGPRDVLAEGRADGCLLLRSSPALGPYPRKITERLDLWAARAPERVLFAQRNAAGGWRSISYGEARERARRIGQFLLGQRLSAERPLAVLSGNDIEHGLLHLGALYVGVPYAPISPAYSLLSTDFGKLRSIFHLITPGLVFASDRNAFRKAIDAVINTQRMWCSNQAMIAAMFAFFEAEPPVIVDWAPWHHTAAGNPARDRAYLVLQRAERV